MKFSVDITAPNNNVQERSYIIELICGVFLGMDFRISFDDMINDTVIRAGGAQIIIEDHFFNNFPESLSYLSLENVPSTCERLSALDLPIIFGRDYIDIGEDIIICGLDIFASSFFCLTRWEEFVLPRAGNGVVCDESKLFSVRNHLEKRPVVNEYIDLLSNFFKHFSFDVRPLRDFRVMQTHDVDWLYLSDFPTLFSNLKRMIGDQGLLMKSILTLMHYTYYRIRGENPFDSFADFMDYSEKLGLKNSFYFKMCAEGDRGATYSFDDRRLASTVDSIKDRGHFLGFHPSENCVNDSKQFELELERLLRIAPDAQGGRQHHLLYCEDTLPLWAKNKLGYDSGSGFQYRNGFRSGICYEYQVFDIFSRKPLKLLEIPFVLMDSVFVRKKYGSEQMLKECKEIVDTVRGHNGTLCTVWHTNLYKVVGRKKFIKTYQEIIKYATSDNKSRLGEPTECVGC